MTEFGPQNVIPGDYGMDLPQTQVEERDLAVELRAAKFSKSKEFKVLKEHLQGRIKHYQQYLPDGRPVTSVSKRERDEYWPVAILLIAEFNAVIDSYERAAQVIKEANAKLQRP